MAQKSDRSSELLQRALVCLSLVGVCLLLIWGLLSLGPGLEQGKLIGRHLAGQMTSGAGSLLSHLQNPLALFFVQLLVIVAFSRIVGLLVQKIGQPFVMGEILAGILLGPSLLGMLLPSFSAFLFPPPS